jgi:hypothetical protein
MLKRKGLGVAAAGALAIAALLAVGHAGAAPSNNYYASAHSRSCWRYSNPTEHWVNVCRTYSYRNVYPRSERLYPYSGYYSYRYEAPNNNGPYYGYEPYNGGYGSSLGFSF